MTKTTEYCIISKYLSKMYGAIDALLIEWGIANYMILTSPTQRHPLATITLGNLILPECVATREAKNGASQNLAPSHQPP